MEKLLILGELLIRAAGIPDEVCEICIYLSHYHSTEVELSLCVDCDNSELQSSM